MLEGVEDGTGFGGLAVGAVLDPLDQHAAHGPQIGDAGIEIGDLGSSARARARSRSRMASNASNWAISSSVKPKRCARRIKP